MPVKTHQRKATPGRGHRAHMEAAIRGVVSETRSGHAREPVIRDAEVQSMFQSARRGTDLTVAVLGDPMYVRRFRARGWNLDPTILQEPSLAVRHWSELGIPTSKHAHAQRADYFRELRRRFQDEHRRVLAEAEAAYGARGPVISGGFHEHWPDLVKDRVRFLAKGETKLGEAAALHDHLAKTRSPVFR